MAFHIQSMSHEGRGVAHFDKEVWFIQNALPGEIVHAEKDAQKKRIVFAHSTDILQKHPERMLPPCPYFLQCGGCDLQMATATLQQHIKQSIVQNALERIGKIHHLDVPLPYRGQDFRYRNKGRFHIDSIGGKPALGFYAKQSHQLIPVSECLLFSEAFCQTIRRIEEVLYLAGTHLPEAIALRENEKNEHMLTIVTHATGKKQQAFVDALAYIPQIVSLWQEIPSQKGARFVHLKGEKSLETQLGSVRFQLSPGSFFQVNTQTTEVLFQTIKAMLAPNSHEHVLDLYSGIGAIGLYLAQDVAKITGVEPIAQAVEDARKTALDNNIPHATYKKGRAEVWLPKAIQEGLTADAAIVDPPRAGLDERLIDALGKSDIPRLIYVSCNPATLARDLNRFEKYHYHAEQIETIDMFPQTAHVETVCLMTRV